MSSKRKKRRLADAVRRAHRAARLSRIPRRSRVAIESENVAAALAKTKRVRAPEEVTLAAPTKFCFLTAPEDAIKFLALFDRESQRPEVRKITIDFSECATVGLCAYSVLYTKIIDVRDARWYNKLSTFAVPSGSAAVNRMLGIPENTPEPKPVNLIILPMIRGEAVNNQFSKERDRAGTEIVDYLTKILATEGEELTPDGCKYVGNLITEAVGNAEEHSGPWVATGYFVQQYAADPGECHLVLFNTGRTISEGIESPNASDAIRKEAQRLANHHMKKGFFAAQLFSGEWTREALFTLYALQEGVSSKLHERASRGNGTIQMIKAFSELAGSDQRMCILSGAAYILFDGTYSLTEKPTVGDETREVIAFNSENDLEVPPDDRYVRGLSQRFNGTVVSVRFRLARKQQTSLTKKRSA